MTEGLLYDPCILKTILFALPFEDALQIRQLSRSLNVRVCNQHDWWLQKTGQLANPYLSMVNQARSMYQDEIDLFHSMQLLKNERLLRTQKRKIRYSKEENEVFQINLKTANAGETRLIKQKMKRRRLSIQKAELYKQCYEHNIKKLKKLTKN